MSDNTTELRENELAFDVAKQSLVEVTNTDAGSFTDQKPAMKDLIRNADGNKAVGFNPNTPMVEVRYIGIDQGGREYTMPITRIKTTESLVDAARALTRAAGIGDAVHDRYGDAPNTTLDEFSDG